MKINFNPEQEVRNGIDLDQVRKMYPKVISIEEYFHPVKKWTSILDDGTDVRNNDDMKYHRFGLEALVRKCIDSGAQIVQFHCKDEKGESCYPDYNVSELIKQ